MSTLSAGREARSTPGSREGGQVYPERRQGGQVYPRVRTRSPGLLNIRVRAGGKVYTRGPGREARSTLSPKCGQGGQV